MSARDFYAEAREQLVSLLADLEILAGDRVGPSDASWQDVAGTAAVQLRVYAGLLDRARQGRYPGTIVFPSPAECLQGEPESPASGAKP
jgi:hypothetical protein